MSSEDQTDTSEAPGPGTRAQSAEDTLLVHIHITKTGGSTLNHILRSTYGPRHCPVEPWDERWGSEPFSLDDLTRLRKLYPNLKSIAGHQIFGHVDLEAGNVKPRYFALFRDPIKACASRFQHKVVISGTRSMSDFERWAFSEGVRNRHTRYISGTDDPKEAIRIINEKQIFTGLTSRFDESLVMLRGLVAPDLNIAYSPVNVAKDRSVAQRLLEDTRSRQVLRESQSADLELYEYVQNVVYAEQRDRYGARLEEDVTHFRDRTAGFNHTNIFLSRLKAYGVYRPLLFMHRRGMSVV